MREIRALEDAATAVENALDEENVPLVVRQLLTRG